MSEDLTLRYRENAPTRKQGPQHGSQTALIPDQFPVLFLVSNFWTL